MLMVKTRGVLAKGQIRAKLNQSYEGEIVSLLRNGDFEVGIPGYPPTGWWVIPGYPAAGWWAPGYPPATWWVRHPHFRTDDPSFAYWSNESPAEGDHCLKLVRADHEIRCYSQSIEVPKPGRYVVRCKAKATGKGATVG